MTPDKLQEALVEDLLQLFDGETFASSTGAARPLRVYPQETPPMEGWDEADRQEDAPEPYIIVRLQEGSIADPDSPQVVSVILVICLYDAGDQRQGHRDILHVIARLVERYGENRVVRPSNDLTGGSPFTAQYPIRWVLQEDDTRPYYFGGVSLTFEAPAIRQEVPFI